MILKIILSRHHLVQVFEWITITNGFQNLDIPRLSSRLSWSRRNYLRSPRISSAARPSRLKSKAGPAERHPGVLWKPQRFVQVRIVKNVPEMIDDLAISPKLIRKHKLDRSQHECEKCVVAVQQHGFYRRRTDEIA